MTALGRKLLPGPVGGNVCSSGPVAGNPLVSLRPGPAIRSPGLNIWDVASGGFCLATGRRPRCGYSVRDEAPGRDQSALQGNHDNAADRPAISFFSAAADPTLIPATSAAAR